MQVSALTLLIGTLLNCLHFPAEDYEALITKVAQHCNKLIKKPDQCRMISLCSHLFWPPKTAPGAGEDRFCDSDRVLECMQRALKIAAVCNTSLFVEILDRYLYYFENDNPAIQVRYISGLVALINEQNTGVTDNTSSHTAHFKNTIKYIQSRQQAPDTAVKFADIQI